MNIPQIEGLTSLAGPRRSRMAGSKFALPPSFDQAKYSAKWVEQGPQVQEAEQSTVLDFANCEARGWTVFKVLKVDRTMDSEEDAKATKKGDEDPKAEVKKKPPLVPCTRAVGKSVFVLMFRPKTLQKAVNALYAGQSRDIINRELKGETNSVNEGHDDGILTNADLRRIGRETGEEPEGYLPSGITQRPQEAVELNLG